MRPAPLTIVHADYAVLCSAPDGSVDGDPFGLFDYDTRILSRYTLTIDGHAPELIASSRPEADAFVARYRIPFRSDRGRPEGPQLPEDAIELQLHRIVGSGLRDRWTIENHSAMPWAGSLRFHIDADFADVAEVGRERRQRGHLSARVRGRGLELRYSARRGTARLQRGVRVRVVTSTGNGNGHAPAGGNGHHPRAAEPVVAAADDRGIDLEVDLEGRASTTFDIVVGSLVDGRWRAPHDAEIDGNGTAHAREAWRANRLRIGAPEPLRTPFVRAVEDLYSLRNRDLEHDLLNGNGTGSGAGSGPVAGTLAGALESDPGAWVLNAGMPAFTGYFGRDTLTAGWQSLLTGTEALRGAIDVAASSQASEDDAWRVAEPGKMLHELRRGPLSMLGISPRDAYYGSQTTPSMFVLGLSELWHWTGDDAVLRRYRDSALRAIEWSERRAATGDGFITYERRSPAGLRNQGWKDSDEGIRHADGRIAEPPLATVEEQAFHFLALQRMAEILVVLDETDEAERLLARASELRAKWHAAFWMPDERFYALAIDRNGDQVRSITSNPGHALGTGIVPVAAARAVADRLLSPTMFNGWGVRTLASDHPSYNPLAYHHGTVWPVENATFGLAFKRYGLDDHLDLLAVAMIEAAAASPDGRLPEAITGHAREAKVGPSPYPSANTPQAWSASAVIQLVQVMLGIYPFAPLRVLALVRPRLPIWLPELTLRNVRVGSATADLRFSRRPDGSAAHTVTRQDGQLFVVPVGPPADASGQPRPWFESIGKEALERAPGRLVRAARIAVGLER